MTAPDPWAAPPSEPSAAQAPPSAPPAAQAPPWAAPPTEPPAEQAPPPAAPPDASASDQNGLVKCPRCGSTDIAPAGETGMLRCAYCRFEWQPESASVTLDINGDIGSLRGLVTGAASGDIIASASDVITLKCGACGAEVVIDTAHSTQARCHWCRNTLSLNQQVPNGAVPDMILPFSVSKEQAVASIDKFVRARGFFAHPTFKREFRPENVMGVYLPYLVVDVNAHTRLRGHGEHQTRRYTVGSGDDRETRYDADEFAVARDFDVHINDLTVESSIRRLNQTTDIDAGNIINSVLPFDVRNAVAYDSNYLRGFTSEKRDLNIAELEPIARTQSMDVARYAANQTLDFYDRGVRWDQEGIEVIGQRWVSAYLPIWLYSYYQRKSSGKAFLHYVAVNGRTGETMGSVPINQGLLLGVSAIIELLGAAAGTALIAAVVLS